MKYAVADTFKTTSGVIAIIFMSSLATLIILNDVIGLGCYLFGKNEKKVQLANDHKKKAVKLVYLAKGGSKY